MTNSDIKNLIIKGHIYGVNSVAVFPDGSKIVSGSRDKTIKIWDATTLQLAKNLINNADNNNLFGYCFDYEGGEVAFSPDGVSLAMVCGKNVEVTSFAPNALQLWKNYAERPDAFLRSVKSLEIQEMEKATLQLAFDGFAPHLSQVV